MGVPTCTVLSLCSGIGGLDLGYKLAVPGARTVCYVEGEAYCISILAARMAEGALDEAPVWSDLGTFDPLPWRGLVDVVIAGLPCQPFSVAGKRGMEQDPRDLWPVAWQIVCQVAPRFFFMENVSAYTFRRRRGVAAVRRTLAEVAQSGWHAEWGHFYAANAGAPHIRERLFLLCANPAGGGREEGGASRTWQPYLERVRQVCTDAHRLCLEKPASEPAGLGLGQGSWWAAEPAVGRMADGIPARVDRIRALGNSCLPEQAAYAFATLHHRITKDL